MKIPLIVGNWKMNLQATESKELASKIREFSEKINEPNLNNILVKQISAEIKIFSENKSNFIYVNSNKLMQITKDIFKGKL